MCRELSRSRTFEFLPHVADAYIAAYGRTLAEAFESAAFAMTELMTDAASISEALEDEVSVSAHDEKALLYSWLEQLILNFDIEGKIYSRFKVTRIEQEDSGWILNAKLYGDTFDPERHPSRTEVKAVTYHKMEIRRGRNGYVVKFILDL